MKVPGAPVPKTDGMARLLSSTEAMAAPSGEPAAVGLVAARAGLGTDFRSFYDAWFDDVARWVRALGGLDADREDIVQEVFLVVRRRLPDFDGANPAGWLYQITRRQVSDFRRRTWVKHIFNRRRVEDPDALPHATGEPAAALEAKEKQRILYALLAKIPEDRRCAFVLFEIEGLSGEEIAHIQGIPLNTVWSRLYHARREFFALAARYQAREKDAQQKRTERT
ncbi:MAG TPA: RNA polymerase sigma factor [Polyangia bacterium]|nr:RNA polymerase sigma factor [Polyangia bacterium]